MAFDFDKKEMIDCTSKETDLDKYGVWVKKPPRIIEITDEIQQEAPQEEILQEENLPDVFPQKNSFQEEMLQESIQKSSPIDELESMARAETGIIDVDFLDDFTNNISEELDKMEEDFNLFPEPDLQQEPEADLELPPEFVEESLTFMEETIPETENFTDAEGKPVEENNLVTNITESEEVEISVDDFLKDSDEISLDTFMDTPYQEKNDILDETPMEMELTFDDDFTVNTTPETVDQIDGFTVEEMDDFDQMFDNIVDEAAPVENTQAEAENTSLETQEFQFDEVTEFDDLLSEFSQPTKKEQKEGPKDYNLTVSVDDEDLSRTTMSETTSGQDDNENILLDSPEREKNNENEESSIARLQITDYTDKSYNSDDFDVDKIMAEVEDIGEKAEEIQPHEVEISDEISNDQQVQQETQDCTMEMPEEAMEFNQNEMEQPAVSPTDELIRSIAGEIALLRNEITSLRNDFEAFKCGKLSTTEDSPLQQEAQQESSGGFFADDTDDDTIALSGDELSNIFNTADFTEESVDAETQLNDEDSENGLPSMDFDSETLEEPIIEDNYFEDDNSEDFPSEIDVPTGIVAQQEQIFEEIELEEEDQGTEEIFEEADSTETDSLEESFNVVEEQLNETKADDTKEAITEEFVEPALDSDSAVFEEEIEPAVEEFAEPVVEDFVEEITDEPVESVFESNQWEAPVVEEVTEEVEPVVEEITEEVEPVVEEITEESEPVESAFESNQWEIPAVDETMGFTSEGTEEESPLANDPLIIEEPVDTISVAEEELLEELEEIPVTDELQEISEVVTEDVPEEATTEEPKTANIPEDLKQDIKSVLSYMDQLLDNLPEDKIAEFARSEHFELYKKLFTELGL